MVGAASGRLAALLVAAEAAPRWADSAPQCVLAAVDNGDGVVATRCEARVQPAHEDAALVLVDVVDLQVLFFSLRGALNDCTTAPMSSGRMDVPQSMPWLLRSRPQAIVSPSLSLRERCRATGNELVCVSLSCQCSNADLPCRWMHRRATVQMMTEQKHRSG